MDSGGYEKAAPEGHSLSLKRHSESGPDLELAEGQVSASSPDTSRKRPRLDGSDTEIRSLDEGEIIDSESEPRSPAPPEAEDGPSPRASTGWNRGISSGLRTSFGSTATGGPIGKRSLRKGPALESAHPVDSERIRKVDDAYHQGTEVSQDLEKSHREGLPGQLPPGQAADTESSRDSTSSTPLSRSENISSFRPEDWQLPSLPAQNFFRAKTWPQHFETWYQHFITSNAGKHELITESLIQAAYAHYTEGIQGLPKKRKRGVTSRLADYARAGKLRNLISKSTFGDGGARSRSPKPTEAPNHEPSASEWASLLTDVPNGVRSDATDRRVERRDNEKTAQSAEELAYLKRYFPGLSGANFCLLCASYGHHYSECTQLDCQYCDGQGHTPYACPTRVRCAKCRQLGHTKDVCQEKLALAPGESDECAFCQAKEHTEKDCDSIWRSYEPDMTTIKKVREIPIFCYRCGAVGHYGTECGLGNVDSMWSEHETWSKMNHDRYVDVNSPDFAVCLDPLNALPPGRTGDERPDFGGRGIAPRTHVYFSDSESEAEEGFIRQPIQRPHPVGQIRFSTNISSLTSGVNGSQGGNSSNLGRNRARAHQAPFLPPLPPGPPPPLPPQNGERRQSGPPFRGARAVPYGQLGRQTIQHSQPQQGRWGRPSGPRPRRGSSRGAHVR